MSYEEAESVALGQYVAQVHQQVTGEPLQFLEMPCLEAIDAGTAARRELDRAVTDLLNDTAHP